jgi:hypothetical protein
MAKLKTVTEIATCTKPSWSNRQRAQFHAFNPNGLVAEYLRLSATIAETVGTLNLPQCGFDGEYQIMLYKMCTEKAVKRSDLWLAMWGLERRIQQARAFIEESKATA